MCLFRDCFRVVYSQFILVSLQSCLQYYSAIGNSVWRPAPSAQWSGTILRRPVSPSPGTPLCLHLHWLSSCLAVLQPHQPPLSSLNLPSKPLLRAFDSDALPAYHSQVYIYLQASLLTLFRSLFRFTLLREPLQPSFLGEHLCYSPSPTLALIFFIHLLDFVLFTVLSSVPHSVPGTWSVLNKHD